jgi:DNA repair exonuclease SbcCD ATPase subunit
MHRLLLSPAVLAIVGTLAAGAQGASLLDEVVRAADERDRLRAEKEALHAEAARLAERLSGKDTAAGKLREFDRLANRLDRLDREIASRERSLERTLLDFEAAAAREERRLEARARAEGALAIAPDLAALAAARQRADALRTPAVVRAALDVTLDDLDGPAELETKLALVDAEKARLASEARRLAEEATVLGARIEAKREWTRRWASARRDAAGGLELVEQAFEEAEARLRRLQARADELSRDRDTVSAALKQLDTRRVEIETRLRDVRKVR